MSWHSVWHFTWYSIWHMLTFSPALHLAFYLTFSAALYLTFNFFFFGISFVILSRIYHGILWHLNWHSIRHFIWHVFWFFSGSRPRGSVGRFWRRWQTAGGGSIPRWSASKTWSSKDRASEHKRPSEQKKIWHVSGIWFVILSNMFFAFFISLNWHATWQRHSCWHISDILSEILSGTVYGSDRAQKANKFATEWLSRGYWHTTWPRHVGKDARSGKWMSAVCVRVCVCEYLVKNQRPSAKMTTCSENRQRNMDETDQIPIIQIRSTIAGGTATPRVLPQNYTGKRLQIVWE